MKQPDLGKRISEHINGIISLNNGGLKTECPNKIKLTQGFIKIIPLSGVHGLSSPSSLVPVPFPIFT